MVTSSNVSSFVSRGIIVWRILISSSSKPSSTVTQDLSFSDLDALEWLEECEELPIDETDVSSWSNLNWQLDGLSTDFWDN